MLETAAEISFARQFLQRRFPEAYSLLTRCLEEADPLEIVYPGNPGEYEDVVREIVVLADCVNGDLGRLSRDEVEAMVREGLGRCFGEEPDEARLETAVNLIRAGTTG
jgi:hypothetical protein